MHSFQLLWFAGSHDDTYAESFHRDFFKNWSAGVPPVECSRGTEGHNTASIGGFVMLPPVILGSLQDGVSSAKAAALRHLTLTHESSLLAKYAQVLYTHSLIHHQCTPCESQGHRSQTNARQCCIFFPHNNIVKHEQ